MTGASRKKVAEHNTGTHFFMGKHSTIHYSQTALTTMNREGLTRNKDNSNSSAASMTQASNFSIAQR